MKKLSLIILTLLTVQSFAQENEWKFGIKLFPAIAWSRTDPATYVDSSGTTNAYSGNSAKFRGGAGIFGDYYFTDNYAISIGLNYIVNSSGFEVTKGNALPSRYNYAIQYLQIPLGFKLFTNELAENLKVYCQVGATVDFRVGVSVNDSTSYQNGKGAEVKKFLNNVNFLSSNFTFSPGVEYEYNKTILFVGITYSRGLFDVFSYNKDNESIVNPKSGFTLYNDYISLDLGVKF